MKLSSIMRLNKTSQETAAGASRQSRVYVLLALVNLAGAGATVVASRSMMSSYEGSVRSSEAAADDVQTLGDLVRIAGDSNAPGNDVFETRDVPAERAHFAKAAKDFRAALATANASLVDGLPPAEAGSVRADLAEAERSFGAMERATEDIFKAFEKSDTELAGKHMAAMDARFGDVRARLEEVGRVVRAHQKEELAASLQSATSAKQASDVIGGAVVLMVLAVSAYGLRLAQRFAAAQKELSARTRDMRLVLDHVDAGLATISRDGAIGDERSAAIDGWLGKPKPDDTLWSWLARSNTKAAGELEMGWNQLVDDFLPIEVALDQLPKEIRIGERYLALAVRPICGEGGLEQCLVVFSDVTAARAAARAERSQSDVLRVVDRALSDRQGTLEFFEEAGRLVERIATWTGDWKSPDLARDLHTLKGNAGIYGISHVAETCHLLEIELSEIGEIDREHALSLQDTWLDLTARVAPILGERRARSVLEIEPEEHGTVMSMLAGVAPRDAVRRRLASWRHESVAKRFARLGEHAQRLGERLGKGAIEIDVEGGQHRLPASSWAGFWAGLVHVVRNAVDHGFETPEERALAGKPPAGRLRLHAVVEEGEFRIVIEDDGRGVDWSALARKAHAAGLPHATHADLVEAIFAEGVTSRDEVTDVSGRGVGAGAARAACERLRGRVDVSSVAGRGTRFAFCFDQAILDTVVVSIRPGPYDRLREVG